MKNILFLGILFFMFGCANKGVSSQHPNFIIIFTDDQGYADLSCYGGTHVSTPRLDEMAEEGIKLTSFYVAAPVCTPSRAALMTGCYPKRIDMAVGSSFGVLLAADTKGLNPDEVTIAEILKGQGYKTGMFGKWHLGDQPSFMPTNQGFDEFFGIPYSHNIHPLHPNKKHNFPPLPLLDGDEVIETEPDMEQMTKRFTQRAVQFIEENKEQPFFLYLPNPMPHTPLYASEEYMNTASPETKSLLSQENNNVNYSAREKLYPQVISEIDWSVGEILDALKANGIDENTMVIFTSDNGPMIGSAKPLKGKKGTTHEGGMREPAIIRWPGAIPPHQVCDEVLTNMDFLPTIAKLAGAEISTTRIIDGKDIWPVLAHQEKSPHEAFFYHKGNQLEAVRSGKWKLRIANKKALQLYNLDADMGETKNVIEGQDSVVARLMEYIEAFNKDMSQNIRPAAYIENPQPLSK